MGKGNTFETATAQSKITRALSMNHIHTEYWRKWTQSNENNKSFDMESEWHSNCI